MTLFRSRAWGRAKQGAHRTAMVTRTIDSADFREAARKSDSLLDPRMPVQSEADYQRFWQQFGTLPSCTECGPVLKFARWMSIQEAWKYNRSGMWLLQLVLGDKAPTEAWRQCQSDSAALLDTELAKRMTTGGKGLLARAPSYITQ